MIASNTVAIAEWVIDHSGAVETIIGGYRTSSRGKPANPQSLRLLLIGLFLAIHTRGDATIQSVHCVLTSGISSVDQQRLGLGPGDAKFTLSQLYYWTKTLTKHLGYGNSQVDLDDVERERRHTLIRKVCDALMDVFIFDQTSTTYALDATGIWSWGIGKRIIDAPNDPTDAADATDATGHACALSHPDGLITQNSSTGPAATSKNGKPVRLHDPDAAWGYKTARGGEREIFYGFAMHSMVTVPHAKQSADAEPRLVRRFELTPANQYAINVSLSLTDRLHTRATDLIVDRLYSNAETTKWRDELSARSIHQHHDLRKDQHGFSPAGRMLWTAGHPHCPATPAEFATILRPAANAARSELNIFAARIAQRQPYALQIHTKLDETNSTMRVRCPALAGTIGCPLRPGTVVAALTAGIPIVENPPTVTPDGETLPTCCTQTTVKVTVPEKMRKLIQPHYWGSPAWTFEYNKRTYVEGSYGNIKNSGTENVRRGHHHLTGLPLTNLVMAMVNASYNVRMTRNWHARQVTDNKTHTCQLCNENHVLITESNAPETIIYGTWEEHTLLEQHRAIKAA